jgi:hypothetical protein
MVYGHPACMGQVGAFLFCNLNFKTDYGVFVRLSTRDKGSSEIPQKPCCLLVKAHVKNLLAFVRKRPFVFRFVFYCVFSRFSGA